MEICQGRSYLMERGMISWQIRLEFSMITDRVASTYGIGVWSSIRNLNRNLWPLLERTIQYRAGDGIKVLFWKEVWIGQEALMNSYPDL